MPARYQVSAQHAGQEQLRGVLVSTNPGQAEARPAWLSPHRVHLQASDRSYAPPPDGSYAPGQRRQAGPAGTQRDNCLRSQRTRHSTTTAATDHTASSGLGSTMATRSMTRIGLNRPSRKTPSP